MKINLLFIAVAIVAIALTGTKFKDSGTVRFDDHFIVPFPHEVENPCNGEIVDMVGNVNVHIWGHVTPNGNVSANYHQNFSGISGVGRTTGDAYQCAGAGTQVIHLTTSFGHAVEVTQNLIHHGSGENLLIHFGAHLTVNANGDVTVNSENIDINCR